MRDADRLLRWSTAVAVLGVAAVAAVASYEHGYDLVRASGDYSSEKVRNGVSQLTTPT